MPARRFKLAKTSSKRSARKSTSPRRHQVADAESLTKYARNLFVNATAKERGYAPREYQIAAAVRAISQAIAGRNSAIELPTGTGKTLIACLAAAFWKKVRPDSRSLLVVPSRTLVVQHADVARWIMPELVVSKIEDDHSGDPGAIRSTMLRTDFLITTPGIVASALKRQVVDQSYVNSVGFVIVDEFDSFVVSDEHEHETEARFATSWSALRTQLAANVRFLIKSATLNLAPANSTVPQSRKAKNRSNKIVDELKPLQIQISESDYAAVVPFQALREVPCSDLWINALVAAVSSSKGILHARLDDTGGLTDYRTVERTAPHICQRPGLLPQRYRKLSPSTQRQILALYCGIAELKMMPQFIFEDLTLGLGTVVRDATLKTSSNQTFHLKDGVFLDDGRKDGRFEFRPGAKARLLVALLQGFARKKHRSVVFCRTVRTLEALRKILKASKVEFYQLTGELSDDERAIAIRNFRKSTAGTLLMTRTTGGRGIDLPFADCAIFYSPKTDPVQMWQEMSRIRSTVSNRKETFVLCYSGTFEQETFNSVVLALKARQLQVVVEPAALERFIPRAVLGKLQ